MSIAGTRAWTGRTVSQTRLAVRTTLGRRDARAVFFAVTGAYLLLYLFAVGHLRRGLGGVGLAVVQNPVPRMFETMGFLAFEPIALVELGPVTLLVAPVNLAIGVVLSALVGVNLAVSYLVYRQPAACGIGGSAGAFAGLPALLSGAACCGPVVLIAVGIQATGLVLAAFSALVPIAVLLLVGSLLYVGSKVNPAAITA